MKFNILGFCSLRRKCSACLIALTTNVVSCILETFSVNSFSFVLVYLRNGRISEKLLSFVKTSCIFCMMTVYFKIDLN